MSLTERSIYLQSIQRLWIELEHTSENTPEHKALMNKIRILSAKYRALVDAYKVREESN